MQFELQRIVLCKNLHTIADDCNVLVDNLSKNIVKQNSTFSKLPDLPDDQNWKIPLICELLDLRPNNFSVRFIYHEFNDMICFFNVLTNK